MIAACMLHSDLRRPDVELRRIEEFHTDEITKVLCISWVCILVEGFFSWDLVHLYLWLVFVVRHAKMVSMSTAYRHYLLSWCATKDCRRDTSDSTRAP